MKLFFFIVASFVAIFIGCVSYNEIEKDVTFRDACHEKGGMFKMQGIDRKCFEVKEIQLFVN